MSSRKFSTHSIPPRFVYDEGARAREIQAARPSPVVDPLEIAAYQCARALSRPMPTTAEQRDRAIEDFMNAPTTALDRTWSGLAHTTLSEIGFAERE
ncbi:MAG TPA: hypothetical protein VHC69_31620 [Polyangiaceae bacterium]|nr:hypothetical protein [Polyangiaceae bacterium]